MNPGRFRGVAGPPQPDDVAQRGQLPAPGGEVESHGTAKRLGVLGSRRQPQRLDQTEQSDVHGAGFGLTQGLLELKACGLQVRPPTGAHGVVLGDSSRPRRDLLALGPRRPEH